MAPCASTAIGILIGLFAIQSHGTTRVGAMFGPIMLVCSRPGGAGRHAHRHIPGLVEMLNPLNAFKFYFAEPLPPSSRWAAWCWP
jgi:KUP system potassium uptake protein